MQTSPGGTVDTWSNAEVDDAVDALQSLDTNLQALLVDQQEQHDAIIDELRVADQLLVTLLVIITAFFVFIAAGHFTPTQRDIGGQ